VQNFRIISSNHGYDDDRWDMCIVLPMESNNRDYTERGQKIVKRLIQSGAELYCFYDHSRNDIFVLVRYTQDKLGAFADFINYEMLLDPVELKKICEEGNPKENISPVTLFHDPNVSRFLPYEYIHARYVRNETASFPTLNTDRY
jgi:hypothetical protein